VGGQVVGSRARRRGDEQTVANQLLEPDLAVYEDPELRGLMGLAQQRYLVERERFVNPALAVGRRHDQGMDDGHRCLIQALDQAVLREFVHQESDGPPVHAVNRLAGVHEPVQHLKHEAIAAQRDDHLGRTRIDATVAGLEAPARGVGFGNRTGQECDGPESRPRGLGRMHGGFRCDVGAIYRAADICQCRERP